MFKNLFKPKWQHKDFAVRKIAVGRLSVEKAEDVDVLEQLASADPHAEVRRAAIVKVINLVLLCELLAKENSKELKPALQQRIAEVISDDDNGVDPEQKLKSLAELSDPALYQYVLQNSEAHQLQMAAIEHVDDQEKLEQLAIDGKVAKVRQIAASRLTDFAKLQNVANASKGKDKSVFRIVKERLDERKEEERKRQEEQAECERLCGAIESHSRTAIEPLYEPKLNHLLKQWGELESEHKPVFEERFQSALSVCQKALGEYQAEEHKRQQEGEKNRDAQNELEEAYRVIEEAFALVKDTADVKDVDFPAIQGVLKTQLVRWEEAASVVTPDGSLKGRFNKATKDLEQFLEAAHCLIDNKERLVAATEAVTDIDRRDLNSVVEAKKSISKLLKKITWPTLVKTPLLIQSAQASIDQLEKYEQQLHEQKKQNIDVIKKHLKTLEEEIAAGKLKAANKRVRDTQNVLKRIPIKDAERYQQMLRKVTVSLNELRDWQGYATTPKKQQLCEQMEALIDSDLEAQELADQIKLLQQEWRSLGQAEPKLEQDLWRRFKEAGDKAFEPCRAFFSEQASNRQGNLESRKQLCQQLQDYLNNMDWDGTVEWNKVLDIIKLAKQEWRSYSPVERKANQPVQDEFDKLLDQLQGKLDGERDNNAKKKEELVQQVIALIEHEDLDFAIGEAKRLQQDWKKIGLVQRKVDHQLWKSFREACDKVFERRQQRWDEEQALREGNQEKAAAVCDALEEFLASPADVLLESKGRLKQFKEDFSATMPLPKAVADELRKRFNGLSDQLIAKIDQAKHQAENQRFDKLWEKASICDELETSIISGSLSEDTLSEFKERWSDTGELPDAAVVAMNARFDSAIDAFSENNPDMLTQILPENTHKRHELALRMEIVTGVDSPAEDQQKRMELQVNRLSQSLTGASGDEKLDERRALLIQWCALGPVDSEESSSWQERFVKAYSA